MNADSVLLRHSLTNQVLERLLHRIRGGIYPAHTQLPPENMLASEFGVSRATIRAAIEFLAARNLVIRRQGIGTFVSALAQIRDPIDQAVLFQTMIENNGYRPGVRFLPATLVKPTARHVRELNAGPKDRLLCLPKIFTADGKPVIYCTNVLAPLLMDDDLVRSVLADPAMTEPIFEFLEKNCGVRITFYIAGLRAGSVRSAKLPDKSFPPATPVLTIDEIAYDTADRPVMHSVHHYPGDRMNFELVRRRSPAAASA